MEKTLDSLLAGRSGSAVVLKDRAGREYESPARVIAQPVAGYDVELTLDAELQEIAQRAPDAALRRMDADGGDVAMLDPATGEALAIASRGRDGAAERLHRHVRAGVHREDFRRGVAAGAQAGAPGRARVGRGRDLSPAGTHDHRRGPAADAHAGRCDPGLEQHRDREVRGALDASRAVPDAAGFRLRHAHGDRISRGGGGEVAAAVRVDPPERREPRHWLRAVGDTDPDGGRVRRAGERRVAAAADAHSRSAQPGGPAAVPPRAGAGAPRGVARDRDGAARPAARGGGARHRCRGGTHQLSGGRENRDGASRGEWSLRGGAVHGVVRGLVPGGQAAAGARREDRQSAQGEPFRGANRRARHALHARTGPGGAHRCARPGAALDRRAAHGSGAARGRRRRRTLRRPLAVSAGFGGRGAASDGARCDGPPPARSGPGAAPARLPRGVEGVGDRRAHLARGGRQRRDRRDGHVVRRASHPGGGRRGRAAACEAMTRLPDLVSALERGGLLVGTPDLHTWPEITGLTADSRRIAPGMLYCAVRGSAQDGHQFVAAARERGAVAALVEREQPVELPQVLVRDGRRAAALAAETWFGRPAARLDLVGVTGTSGKTTSVLLARHVLSALEPMGSIGTLGAFDPAGASVPSEAGNLTTPGPIDLQATLAALVARGARGATMEVSSHSLDQGRVDGLAFRAAIFTNLTRDHLDYHKTVEQYFRAKAKLLDYLAPDGLEVVNADDPAWRRLRRGTGRRRVTFGENAADVTARRVEMAANGCRFELVAPTGTAPVRLPLLGRFNVSNALGVAACAFGLGLPVDAVAERLSSAPQVPGRMERI